MDLQAFFIGGVVSIFGVQTVIHFKRPKPRKLVDFFAPLGISLVIFLGVCALIAGVHQIFWSAEILGRWSPKSEHIEGMSAYIGYGG